MKRMNNWKTEELKGLQEKNKNCDEEYFEKTSAGNRNHRDWNTFKYFYQNMSAIPSFDTSPSAC